MSVRQSATSLEVIQLPAGRTRPNLEPASDIVVGSAQRLLQQTFDQLIAEDDCLASWIRKMQQMGLSAAVFGGWARDRIAEMITGRSHPSRDIDLVAFGDVSVAKALPEDAVPNHFGGFGTQATRLHVDAWNLKDTFLIKRKNLPATFEQLPLTADYTVNAIVFKPSQLFAVSELIDCGAIAAIQSSTLEFAADEVAQPRVQAARVAILAVRLQLQPSPTVRSFVKTVCGTNEARKSVMNGILTYCPAPWKGDATSMLAAIISEGL